MTLSSTETSLLIFVVSLLVGGFGIHIGSKLALKSRGYVYAVVTALFGALAWAVVEYLFSRAGLGGLLSSIVALLVWISVIRWRYEIGWIRASVLALGSWFGALLALFLLAIVGVGNLDALGVPGV